MIFRFLAKYRASFLCAYSLVAVPRVSHHFICRFLAMLEAASDLRLIFHFICRLHQYQVKAGN